MNQLMTISPPPTGRYPKVPLTTPAARIQHVLPTLLRGSEARTPNTSEARD